MNVRGNAFPCYLSLWSRGKKEKKVVSKSILCLCNKCKPLQILTDYARAREGSCSEFDTSYTARVSKTPVATPVTGVDAWRPGRG